MLINKPLILSGASGTTAYTIDQSIRFNSADSGYMHRTPSSSGNRKTFTSSFWVKFGDLTNCALPFPSVYQNASYGAFLASGIIQFFIYYTGSAWQGQLYTNRVFRDPSAWYHFVIVVDTTNAIAGERVRIYINGQRESSFSTENYPNLNQDTDWNNSGEKMGIGVNANGFGGSFGEYYAAEMHYLDGYAYGPEYFGETNSSGIWIPKEYSDSYGTNGFYIKGESSSDLGNDSSGNNNDFTTSGISAHDQVFDSPTNNFCVLNPTMNMTYQYLTPDIRGVNLASQAVSASLNNYAIGSMGVKSGKWYFEAEYPTYPALSGARVGFISLENASSNIGGSSYGKEKVVLLSNRHTSGAFSNFEWGNGSSYPNTSATSQTPFVQDDIIGVAFDCDNSTIQFYKNGSTFGSQFDYSAQSNSVDTSDGDTYAPIIMGDNTTYTNKVVLNFGQDSTFNGGTTAGGNSDGNGRGNFKYSVPSGYLALCTANLGS